ncbi:MAG: thiamine phosphate synthase [Candidatus Coatesbacteria bacterium]
MTPRRAATRRLAATGVYAILGGLPPRGLVSVARRLRRGGIRVFQLRLKHARDRDILRIAGDLRRALGGCTLVLNDRCDLAGAAGVDGVHLGQDDLPLYEARRLLGPGVWIGLSAGTPAEVAQAVEEHPDYISLGPAYATRTKRDAGPALGGRGFRRLAGLAGRDRPLLAVGGVRPDNVGDLIGNGATAVAAASWLTRAADPEGAARRLMEAVSAARRSRRGV